MIALALAALALSAAARAADPAPAGGGRVRPAPVDVAHVTGKPKLDGVLDEALWQQATKFEVGIETRPAENTPAEVKTTVYLAENGDSVLVAFVAEDPDPSKIRAFLRDRDSGYNDDFVGVVLDTFDDQRRAYEFFVNPLGAQMDLIMDDQNGNEDDSWDGVWDSAGKITATGYVVEMEIPFSTMRFQGGKGMQQWGADFLRFQPRAVRHRISSNKLLREVPCYLCQVGRVRGFAGVEPGSNLEINPTLTTTYSQDRPAPGTPFGSEGLKFDPGVDVKWGPSPNMTLYGTVNPDFSQVEADSGQLDVNNTFALFFPEKRPFFLDGADYFATYNTLVYTRNVNDPDLGLRVTGRNGKQAYGVFVARDTVTDLLLPGVFGSSLARYDGASNDGAFRYRYDVSKALTLGALVTARTGDDYRNIMKAVDGKWQKGSHTLTAQYMRSDTQDPDFGAILAHDSHGDAYSAEYDYNTRAWSAFAYRNDFDDGFRADLGFMGQVGFVQNGGGLTRHWWGDKDDVFNHITLNARWVDNRTQDGTLLDITRESWIGANGPLQSYYEYGHVEREKEWNGVRFQERINRIRAQLTPISGLTLELFARAGDKVDLSNTKLGKLLTINPEITLNLGKSLSASINHNYERLSRDGGDVYVANLTDLRLSYQFSLRQRLRLAILRNDLKLDPALFAQWVPVHQRAINTQLIYSYKITPRAALYAGYADGYFGGNVNKGTDEAPIFDFYPVFQTNRTLFLKLSYAWNL
jgi:hypothetical protein